MNPFLKFLLRKAFFITITYILFLTIIFLLPRVIPGNPLSVLLSQLYQQAQANPELIKAVHKRFMEEFGFDKPWHIQYINFIFNTLRGDLGTSIAFYPRKVIDLISSYLPWTLGLLLPATLVSWIIGNLLGALAAYKRGTIIDNALLPVFLTLSQTPYYWLAMLLLYAFAVSLRIFPASGAYSPTVLPSLTLEFIVDMLWHYALPFLSIIIGAIGGWAIGMRVLVIYELGSDHINYADALGLPDRKLLMYSFKNSILPQITGLALSLGTILGGSLITELVFSYPGMGYLMFRALSTLDYPMIQGVFVVLTFTLLLANFIVDIIYAYIDPRIRTGYLGE